MSKPKKAAKKKPAAQKKPAPKAKAAPKKAVKPKIAAKPAAKAAKPPAKAAKAPAKAAKPVAPAKPVKGAKGKVAAPAPIPPAKNGKAAKTAAKPELKGKGANGKAKAAPVEAVEETQAPPEPQEEVVLTDAEGRRYCRVKDCDQLASVDTYCRYHYLLFWKKIQVRKKILTEGKLERYIEDLTARYPDKFLDMLRKDLKNEKDFLAAIQELEIDESAAEGEFEEEAETFIDEVRGMNEPAAREEEDF